jgi:hypothetical protein
MDRVKPRKITIKNIWWNKELAKFSMCTILLLFSHNYYGNIDNNVIFSAIVENFSNPVVQNCRQLPAAVNVKMSIFQIVEKRKRLTREDKTF